MSAGVAIGGLIWGVNKGSMGAQPEVLEVTEEAPPAPKPENAVLVFGASGKLGRLVVKEVRSYVCLMQNSDAACYLQCTQPRMMQLALRPLFSNSCDISLPKTEYDQPI